MSTLLTDDEVVAVAVTLAKAWPHPLPTVDLDSDAILAAGARGARSLLVRGLAQTEKSSLSVDQTIGSLVDRVISSSGQAIAYVADRSAPAALAGSSTYLYLSSAEKATVILDLVSSSGVHDLREVEFSDGVDIFLAGVKNVFSFGFRSGDGDRDPALFVATTFGARAVEASQGRLAFGSFGSTDGPGDFAEDDVKGEWNLDSLAEALGFSTLTDVKAAGKGKEN